MCIRDSQWLSQPLFSIFFSFTSGYRLTACSVFSLATFFWAYRNSFFRGVCNRLSVLLDSHRSPCFRCNEYCPNLSFILYIPKSVLISSFLIVLERNYLSLVSRTWFQRLIYAKHRVSVLHTSHTHWLVLGIWNLSVVLLRSVRSMVPHISWYLRRLLVMSTSAS